MSQQMVNGSHYDGDITVTNRMSDRYAVVNPPEQGKHRKTEEQRKRRHFINRRPGYSWCTTLRGIAIEGVKLE